jgi:hypothetical protein
VYAWRPGWSTPKKIAGTSAVDCAAHTTLPLVQCRADMRGGPSSPEIADLRAGPLSSDGEVNLESVALIHTSSPDGTLSWQARFSPDGELFVLSSPDPDPAVESIRVIPTASIGHLPPGEVIHQASSWELSPNGHRIYFYRSTPAPRTLYTAEFPSGENITKVDINVSDLLLFGGGHGDDPLAYITDAGDGRGAFRLLRDPASPGPPQTVFDYAEGVESVSMSPDLRFTAWTDSHFHGRMIRLSDSFNCDISPGRSVFEPIFLKSAGLLFWNEAGVDDPTRLDGYYADPDGCQPKRRFATGVNFTMPVGDRGVVLGDQFDTANGQVSLKFAPIEGGRYWPMAGPVRIQDNVDDLSVVVVDSSLVVYTVAGGPAGEQGTYVYGPLPF